jgi:hypothetical protein
MIVTSTVRPFARFVIFTRDPKGKLACAATSSSLSSGLPLAVGVPFTFDAKKHASPVCCDLSLSRGIRLDSAVALDCARPAEDGWDFSAAGVRGLDPRDLSGTGDGLSEACRANSGSTRNETINHAR